MTHSAARQVPMHLTLAYLKPKLRGTPFERSHLEPVLNGLNAAMVCIIVSRKKREEEAEHVFFFKW